MNQTIFVCGFGRKENFNLTQLSMSTDRAMELISVLSKAVRARNGYIRLDIHHGTIAEGVDLAQGISIADAPDVTEQEPL